jgi:excisionase family DNA binding protein
MSAVVLIPVNGDWIALTQEQFAEARLRAHATGFGVEQRDEADNGELWSAERVSKHFDGVPVSWIEQAARDGRVPCVRVGKYVRFRRKDVEAALVDQPHASAGRGKR